MTMRKSASGSVVALWAILVAMLSLLAPPSLARADEAGLYAVTAISAGTKPVNQDTYVWGSTLGTSRATVSTEVLLESGEWARSQSTVTSTGSYTLPLTYGSSTPGLYMFRVVATDGTTTVYSDPFMFERTENVSVSATAVRTKPINEPTYVWGAVRGTDYARVSTEVLIGGRWSTSQVDYVEGYFALPLTYGASQPGQYTFRVRAESMTGVVAYSPQFTLTRTSALKVTAASAGSKPVGQTTYVWGQMTGASSARVSVQVMVGGRWSSSQSTTTGGSYTLPLTYGANTPGTYTFRVVAQAGSVVAATPAFTLTRTGVYYPNCDAVRAAGKAPLYRGQPGYGSHLDRDGDGVACEYYRR